MRLPYPARPRVAHHPEAMVSPASKFYEFRLEGLEVYNAHGIEPRHDPGTFARIKDELSSAQLVSIQVCVTVQQEFMVFSGEFIYFQWIMHNEQGSAVPRQLKRWIHEVKAVRVHGLFKRLAFNIIVSENAVERCPQRRESIERLRLSDVACMHYALNARLVEEFNYALNVL